MSDRTVPDKNTLAWLAQQSDEALIQALFHAGRINYDEQDYWRALIPMIRVSRDSAEIYLAGIDDAISYLGGCTVGESEMSTVRGVLSLLKSFKRQGGYSAYKQPSPAAADDIAK